MFVLVPPNFDPQPEFPEARATGATLKSALEAAPPGRVVYLSTVGAQASQSNLLTQHTIIEQAIRSLSIPLTILRPAWFMENCRWDVGPAQERGVIPSFLQPLDRPVPMVATADIGQTAARLLQEQWSGRRIVELEGPARVTPNGNCRRVRHAPGQARAGGDCAARILGDSFQGPRDEKPDAADSDVGRVQRRLD